MKVLIACEFSGVVRDAFKAKGHDAWSCDYLPSEADYQGLHFEGNCLSWIYNTDYEWDLLIAHPPCTFLCNSGVRWLTGKNRDHQRPDYNQTEMSPSELRWEELYKAAGFFKLLLDAPIPKICIENPIPHKYAVELIGRKYDQIIQPWQFGHEETKATCLWLKDLPDLKPVKIMTDRKPKVHHASPGPDRGKLRSITPKGIAKAMAEQWG